MTTTKHRTLMQAFLTAAVASVLGAVLPAQLDAKVQEQLEQLLGMPSTSSDEAKALRDQIWRGCAISHGELNPLLKDLATRLTKKPARPLELRLIRVSAHYRRRLGDTDRAHRMLKRIREEEETVLDTLNKAEILDAMGRNKQAIATYDRLLEKQIAPELRNRILLRKALVAGSAMTTPGNRQRREPGMPVPTKRDKKDEDKDKPSALARFAAEPDRSPELRNQAAVILALTNEQEQAIKLFQATGEGTARFRQEVRLAEWAIEAGNWAKAQEFAWNAVRSAKLRRDRRYALTILVEAYRRDHKLDALVDRFGTTKGLDAESRQVWIDILRETGKVEEALRLFRSAAKGEFTTDMRRELLEICRETNQDQILEQAYDKLITEEPRFLEWREGLARFYLERGRREDALNVWRPYLEVTDDKRYRMAAAASLMGLGLDDLAVHFARACMSGGDQKVSESALLFLYELHRDRGRHDEARKVLVELDRLVAAGAGVRKEMADAYARLGDKKEAVSVLEGLYEALGNDTTPDTRMKLALMLSEIGEEEKALAHWVSLWRQINSIPRRRYVEERLMSVASRLGTLAKVAIRLEKKLVAGTADDREAGLLVRLYIEGRQEAGRGAHGEGPGLPVLQRLLQLRAGGEAAGRDRPGGSARLPAAARHEQHGARPAQGSSRDPGAPQARTGRHCQRRVRGRCAGTRGHAQGGPALVPPGDRQVPRAHRHLPAVVQHPERARPPRSLRGDVPVPRCHRREGRPVHDRRRWHPQHARWSRQPWGSEPAGGVDPPRGAGAGGPASQQALPVPAGRRPLGRAQRQGHGGTRPQGGSADRWRAAHPDPPGMVRPRRRMGGGMRMLPSGVVVPIGSMPGQATPVNADQLMFGRRILGQAELVPPEVYLELGESFLNATEVGNAQKTFNQASQLPEFAEMRRRFAEAFELAGYPKEALRVYEQILSVENGDLGLIIKVGELHEQTGRDLVARGLYEHGLELVLNRSVFARTGVRKDPKPEPANPYAYYSRNRNTDEYDRHYSWLLSGLLATLEDERTDQFLTDQRRKIQADLDRVLAERKAGKLPADGALRDHPRLERRAKLCRRMAVALGGIQVADEMDRRLLAAFAKDDKLLEQQVRFRLNWGYVVSARTLIRESGRPEAECKKLRLLAGGRGSVAVPGRISIPEAAGLLLPLLIDGKQDTAKTLLERLDLSTGDKAALEQMQLLVGSSIYLREPDLTLMLCRHWLNLAVRHQPGRMYGVAESILQQGRMGLDKA
ncbi:MAG: tetratricopeptide repeat protein, partial [Planctomycetota bacterium]